MSSVQSQPEPVSRAGRLDQILRELLHQTPGVEAAAVVSFDGLPMASALPAHMDEDRVAAMSAALLSLAERAAQGLGRGDLSQVYIEGEHGTVFLVSAQDEGVLIAVTAAGAKVGMMLYEVKLAANRVGEVLHGPAPLPAPLPPNVTRGYLDAHDAHAYGQSAPSYEAFDEQSYTPGYNEPSVSEPAYTEPAYSEPAYSEPAYSEPAYSESEYESTTASAEHGYFPESAQPAAPAAPATDNGAWSSYAPIGSVLPGEQGSWT
jgi:predicted regulator of Ras-like GTPase activity (Roadblock/LC7/MglB family)